MKILLDENIPAAEQYFGSLGALHQLPGRVISRQDLEGVDVLLVRSVTRVDRQLLEGSSVRFIGSCTAGVDHIDQRWLAAAGIGFAHAPGANAMSVVEYVLSALAALAAAGKRVEPGMSLGVVGLGQVGGRLYRLMDSLGFRCKGYDPLLVNSGGFKLGKSLEEILQSDIVSLHTPLTMGGAYPTRHLLGWSRLEGLPAGCILINTSRGPVVDNNALKAVLASRDDLAAVFDVWEGEPQIDPALMQQVTLCTPHIAGYSAQGKLRGTQMVCRELCDWLGVPRAAEPEETALVLSPQMAWGDLVSRVLDTYDIRVDDRAMRQALKGLTDTGAVFEQLRRDYPHRQELGIRLE